jgi:hypothetical protein
MQISIHTQKNKSNQIKHNTIETHTQNQMKIILITLTEICILPLRDFRFRKKNAQHRKKKRTKLFSP